MPIKQNIFVPTTISDITAEADLGLFPGRTASAQIPHKKGKTIKVFP
jgi:hypothetical protein